MFDSEHKLICKLPNMYRQPSEHFDWNRSAHEVPQATFWFGHAETLLPVVAALGLFNDSVDGSKSLSFTADDFIRWQDKRRMNPPSPMMFRAGHIAPFSGNLALQLYYCPNAGRLSYLVNNDWAGSHSDTKQRRLES